MYSLNEVFSFEPVASVSTTDLEGVEGSAFKQKVIEHLQSVNISDKYTITSYEIGEVYSHHCAFRPMKKAAMFALPEILEANYVISKWQKPTDKKDKRLIGLVAAPVLIDGEKCLCLVTTKKNLNNKITPYALALKGANGDNIGDKKVNCDNNVHDSDNGNSAFGTAHSSEVTTSLDTSSPSGAKIQQNIETNNNQETNENRIMNKKQIIRLTEKKVKEIVKQVLREAVLPHYDTLAVDVDDDGNLTTARDNDGNEVMFKGEDMFPDDVLYTAEKLRKLTGNKLKITVSNSGRYRMFYSGSLSIDSLELIIKVAKYLRTDRVSLDGTTVTWSDNIDHDKSHKTQVGKKYFDTVPQEHQVTKPRVLHYGWELQPNVGVDMPEGGRGYAGSY